MQVAMQIALLERQTLPQLRGMWQKYFDTPPISQNKEFYISRLAYRIQELRWTFKSPTATYSKYVYSTGRT